MGARTLINLRASACMVAVFILMLNAGCATTQPASSQADLDPEPSAVAAPVAQPAEPEHGLGHKIIWYLPNRFLDLVDVFRLRLRAGPGLALNARITSYADVYIGTYYTAFLGLPGPRLEPDIRLPLGLEYEKGIKLMGVDASDDLPHDPGYSPTEFNVGLHLLLLGAEVGFDPVEFGDFFAGWIMIDLREDDR